MSVNITIPHILKHLTNNVEAVSVNGNTVGDCLAGLTEKYPEIKEQLFDKDGKLLKHIDVFVNGKSAYPDELTTKVNSGDELYIFIVLVGG